MIPEAFKSIFATPHRGTGDVIVIGCKRDAELFKQAIDRYYQYAQDLQATKILRVCILEEEAFQPPRELLPSYGSNGRSALFPAQFESNFTHINTRAPRTDSSIRKAWWSHINTPAQRSLQNQRNHLTFNTTTPAPKPPRHPDRSSPRWSAKRWRSTTHKGRQI